MKNGMRGVRLPPDLDDYCAEQAKERRMTMSEMLRHFLIVGIQSESSSKIEKRLTDILTKIPSGAVLPKKVIQSIIFSELALTAIVRRATDEQEIFKLQDRAKQIADEILKDTEKHNAT